MATWSLRSSGYKFGVAVLFLGTAFFFIGFVSPFWVKSGSSSAYGASGLWMVCAHYYGETSCDSYSLSQVAGWFRAVQAMQCICLVGLFISILYAFVVNCCQMTSTHNRALELMSCGSGIAGFIGTMIYVGKLEGNSDLLSWAFGLNLTGCIMVIIAGIVIFITNRDVQAAAGNTGGAVIFAGAPAQGGNTVVVQQGQTPGYPAQPGMVYGYPQGYPAGAPPQMAAGAPAPAPAPAGYSGYNYPQGYSGQAFYPPTEPPKAGHM